MGRTQALSSATYVTAVDHYGDVLTQTAVTVGDVTGVDYPPPPSAM